VDVAAETKTARKILLAATMRKQKKLIFEARPLIPIEM
jgi:hypothetical protein